MNITRLFRDGKAHWIILKKMFLPPCPILSLKAPQLLAAVKHSLIPTSPADAATEASEGAPQEVQPGYDFEDNYIHAHGRGLFVVLVMEKQKKKEKKKHVLMQHFHNLNRARGVYKYRVTEYYKNLC